MASLPLAQLDSTADSNPEPFGNSSHIARIVRFGPAGDVVVALLDETVYVLRVPDLAEIRRIHPVKPLPVTRDYENMPVTITSFASSLEISPNGETLAIFWASDFRSGRIELYSLSTGRFIRAWQTPEGWTSSSNGLHWHPNGRLIVTAIPNAKSCQPLNHDPDIFGFDVETGATKYRVTSGMDSPQVIITSDNRVLAIRGACSGKFSHNHDTLKVFDLISGKRLHDGSSRVTGVGERIVGSADGKRFLALTGRVGRKFNLGDADFDLVDVDQKFSVWSLTDYKGIVTSQDVPNLAFSKLRLSANGHYAISYGKASFVFDLQEMSTPD